MKALPPAAAHPLSHPHLTRIKSKPAVETADLLGLEELHVDESLKERRSAKQVTKSDTVSSNPPSGALWMHPSHPNILTWETETQNMKKQVSPPNPPVQVSTSVPQPKKQETAQDHAQRINRKIGENEKKLSEMNAVGYVPPHLRPAVHGSAIETEDAFGNYIPPHLRRPRIADGKLHTPNPEDNTWGQANQGSIPSRPHKVSMVLTPIGRASERYTADIAPLGEISKAVPKTIQPPRRALSLTQVQQPMRPELSIYQSNAAAPRAPPVWKPARNTGSIENQSESLPRKTASPPPPPVGGTKIRTAYFPLRPETPPLTPRTRADDSSSYGNQDEYSSYSRNGGHSSYGFNDSRPTFGRNDARGGFLMLDHEKARKMKSYTHYRAKAGFAPHHPRLPFEFLHKIYGQSGATYTATLAERLDSSSVIGPRSMPVPGKTYGHPTTLHGHRIPNDLGNGYRIPKHEHISSYNSTAALSGGSATSERMEPTDLVFKAWPEPPKRAFNKKLQKSRSVILSRLPTDPTLDQISQVCKATGRIENIQVNRGRSMAMVTFVEASTAQRFYETTDSRGVTLIYTDEETNKVKRQQIYIDMNPEVVTIGKEILQVVETDNGSRVLEVIGWTRDILESLVGGWREGAGVGYSDLLMRLASLYCGAERVQCVNWRQNGEGQMEVRLVYAGIQDAMTVRASFEKEPALFECDIAYGSDP